MTIYTSSQNQVEALSPVLDDVRRFVAKVLSCDSRVLDENEISIRIINSDVAKTIAEIEVVVLAHSYVQRVDNQDQICVSLRKFLEERLPSYSIFVWLQLSELGHSV